MAPFLYMLTLFDFYSLPPIFTTYDLSTLIHPHLDLFPELALYGSPNHRSIDNIKLHNTRVSFRVGLAEYYSFDKYQDRHVWVLGAMFLDELPFMVLRNPTDQIDNYPNIMITDPISYRVAVTYLWGFLEPDQLKSPDEYQPLSGDVIPHALKAIPIPEFPIGYVERAINQSLSYNRFK